MFTLRELLLLLLLLFVAEKDTDGCPVRKEEMASKWSGEKFWEVIGEKLIK